MEKALAEAKEAQTMLEEERDRKTKAIRDLEVISNCMHNNVDVQCGYITI